MIFLKTDIELKLRDFRALDEKGNQLIRKINSFIKSKDSINSFNYNLLNLNKVYHINHIKKICIDYRLRFLDIKYFKGVIPDLAYNKINDLRIVHNASLKDFKIMAPSKLFKLNKTDDPLLFVPIGNNYYYLIHKWGNDLNPFRKILMWPLKKFLNLLFSVLLISIIITVIIPIKLFSENNNLSEFFMLFFFIFKTVIAIVVFYGFALGKNFNMYIWNSRYNKS